MRSARTGLTVLAFLLCGACGDDDEGGVPDARPAVDAAGPDAPAIENLTVSETVTMPGLTAAVEVVRDTRGTPHIYAHQLTDAVRVQAYLMARDRFGQMEFLRRLALGRLAELAPLPDLVAMDQNSRFLGYGRQGKAIYDSLPATDPSRQVADAFVAGMNVYVDEIIAAPNKDAYIPDGGATVYAVLFGSPYFGRWEPSDVFAMARFQSANLAYDPGSELARTRALAGARANLGSSRPGAFIDMFSEVQARRVYTRPGFPAEQKPAPAKKARGKRAAPPKVPSLPSLPSLATLDAALAYHARQRDLDQLIGAGSNNWVVSGSKTASGAPILSNDPHLALVSPGVWWYVHLDTKRFGGAGGISVNGVAFASLPGVVLGFNENIAWGATVTGFDVTDVYEETVTEGEPPTVLFNGNQVPIETITEVIRKSGAEDEAYVIEVVPHHGPIIPGTRTGGKALSIRYTGHTPSNELAFFHGLAAAKNVDEAWAAQQHFRVGSQNIVVAARDGDIAWNTESAVPIRDPRALTLEIDPDGTVRGVCPTFVLPGTGEYEWTGEMMPSSLIPKDRNPAKGYIATANQDAVGVTDDGNPCNQPDGYYLGGGFAVGYRQGRIVERLDALTARGGITREDMIALQAVTRSQLGDTLRDPLVAILDTVTAEENTLFTSDEKAQLAGVRARLAAWTRETPHGVGATDPAVIADSVATTIFNVGLTRMVPLAFGDEAAAMGQQPGSGTTAALLERSFTAPETMATYADGATTLWDDVTTDRRETRDEIVGRGFLAALAFLSTTLGEDLETWRWGRLHTVTFASILPFSPTLSIPPPGDPMFPNGFPRPGDWGAVDVGDFNMWSPATFSYAHGPSQRLVVELLPDGPRAHNALPGGQSIDPASPHKDDEARMYWVNNVQPAVHFFEADVVRNAEARLRFVP